MDQRTQTALEAIPQMGLLYFTFKKFLAVIAQQNITIAGQKEGIKDQSKIIEDKAKIIEGKAKIIEGKVKIIEGKVKIIEGKDRELQEKSKRIEELKEEIDRLKKHKSKPKLRSSALTRNNKGKGKKKKRGKQTKPKRQADHTEVIKAEDIPVGSRFKGYRPYVVQTLEIKVKKIAYQLERWQLPDGSYRLAKLPRELIGYHFCPRLRTYILHQYHHQGVTQPLLLSQLHEWGVEISKAELNHLLIDNKAEFHEEKTGILSAGLSVSPYIHVDDTGARHQGQNGYCTHIGNELFAWFESTKSKHRINFLELLRQDHKDYWLTDESFDYMLNQKLPKAIHKSLFAHEQRRFSNKAEWEAHLKALGIARCRHVKIATEGALMGSVLIHGFNIDLVIMSDDAGQFNIFWHILCWIHIERNIAKLIPCNDSQAKAVELIRTKIWKLYQQLKRYKIEPNPESKQCIVSAFDELVARSTCFEQLNKQLKRMNKSRDELLLVLERCAMRNNVFLK